MSPAEFASRMVGCPWVKWRADFDAADCYGVVVLYFREVMGIELEPALWEADSKLDAFAAHSDRWQECAPEAGATCFMAWRDGSPTHCGVLLDQRTVIHAEGSEEHPGSVRVSRLAAMQRVYGQLKFYRYSEC